MLLLPSSVLLPLSVFVLNVRNKELNIVKLDFGRLEVNKLGWMEGRGRRKMGDERRREKEKSLFFVDQEWFLQEVREGGTNVQKDDNGFVFYKCRFCGLTFNFMNTLRAHERIHDVSQVIIFRNYGDISKSQLQPYVCGKCGESFEFACQLEYHAAQHSEVDGFKCDCGRTFFSYTEMLYHKHTDDPIELIGAPEVSMKNVFKEVLEKVMLTFTSSWAERCLLGIIKISVANFNFLK